MYGVHTCTGSDGIITFTGSDRIVPVSRIDRVISESCGDGIITTAGSDTVITCQSINRDSIVAIDQCIITLCRLLKLLKGDNCTVVQQNIFDTAVGFCPVFDHDGIAQLIKTFALLFECNGQIFSDDLDDKIIFGDAFTKLDRIIARITRLSMIVAIAIFVDDSISAISTTKDIGIIPSSTDENIITLSTGNCIVAFTGSYPVITFTCIDSIVTISRHDSVISAAGINRIITASSCDGVVACQCVIGNPFVSEGNHIIIISSNKYSCNINLLIPLQIKIFDFIGRDCPVFQNNLIT